MYSSGESEIVSYPEASRFSKEHGLAALIPSVLGSIRGAVTLTTDRAVIRP